jgi:hypothetical protein
MISPLAVSTGTPKVPRRSSAFRKGPETWPTTACRTGRDHELPAGLNQEPVDVRWPVRLYLGSSHCVSYEGDILSREVQDRSSLWAVYKPTELSTSGRENRVLSGLCSCKSSSVEANCGRPICRTKSEHDQEQNPRSVRSIM